MPSTAEMQENPYKRGTKVRLVDDLPTHPAGSTGKIAVANGFDWLRYWVRFSDGTTVGHVDHHSLVKAKQYDQFLVAREREALEAEKAAEEAANAPAVEAGSGGGAAAGGDGAVVNGVTIPQMLLDRSAAARQRLGA